MKRKEMLTEDLEIQKELEKDDITPIQGRVDKLFADVETTEIEEAVEDTLSGLDWIDISETLNFHLNDPELEDAIMLELRRRAK